MYIAGHGDPNGISTGNDHGVCNDGRNNYKDISSTDFSNAELVILAACHAGDIYENSLAEEICDNGADCVLGWTGSPNSKPLAWFTERYAYNIYKGNTYFESFQKTRNFLINQMELSSDSTVFDVSFFGNINHTLEDISEDRLTSLSSKNGVINYENPDEKVTRLLDDELNQQIIEDKVEYEAESNDYSEIESYMKKNVSSDFNISNYDIKDFGREANGYDFLSFKLKVNGVTSNCGFTIYCLDNIAKLITFSDNYDIGLKINNKNDIAKSSGNEISKNKLILKSEELDDTNDEVVDQKITKYYDVSKEKICYDVETEYLDEYNLYYCTLNSF